MNASSARALVTSWLAVCALCLAVGCTPPSKPAKSSSSSSSTATKADSNAKTVSAPTSPPNKAPSKKAAPKSLPVDPATGLVVDENMPLVVATCTACHSAKLVTQNAGDKAYWTELIRWMQKTQNLWPIAPEVEEKILTYLSTHYGPKTQARRPNLPDHLMPPAAAQAKVSPTTAWAP